MIMFFTALITGLASSKKVNYQEYKNTGFYTIHSLSLSGDLTCALDGQGTIFCWDTYNPFAEARLIPSNKKFRSLSVYGSQACATDYHNVYCTRNIKEDSVDWVLVYSSISDKAYTTVELDENTLCIVGVKVGKNTLKCADFLTVFNDKRAWNEKKGFPDSINEVSISKRRACLTYTESVGYRQKSMCTDDISVESPEWKQLDEFVYDVKINKDKMCGRHYFNLSIICFKDGKWIHYSATDNKTQGYFAIDNTHIVTDGGTLSVVYFAGFL
eukprot:NODE_320_length_11094_cov_0.618190.p3 type:complete len:271 gc:universal NODE_320_length_11094_cov_0.618190:1437-2249(+)